ncbi:MAG: hypothetical protein F4053_06750 [Proteobacteria bacterium]|nr:hypothetical protein [Pseudomonadota bacterium]
MHWSTMACTVWAHLLVPTAAHELGHCFGLLHNGALDVNNTSIGAAEPDCEYGYDLMAEPWSPFYTPTLNPNNRARVERHFRTLEEFEPEPDTGTPIFRID